jgi:hypothetical protein
MVVPLRGMFMRKLLINSILQKGFSREMSFGGNRSLIDIRSHSKLHLACPFRSCRRPPARGVNKMSANGPFCAVGAKPCLTPAFRLGWRAPHEAVPCKGTTAEKDRRHDQYQRLSDYFRHRDRDITNWQLQVFITTFYRLTSISHIDNKLACRRQAAPGRAVEDIQRKLMEVPVRADS